MCQKTVKMHSTTLFILYHLIASIQGQQTGQGQVQGQGSLPADNFYQLLIVSEPYKRQVSFDKQPRTEDVIQILPQSFKEQVFGEVTLQRWSQVYDEYVELNDGELIENMTKIFVMEDSAKELRAEYGTELFEYVKDERMLRETLLQDYDKQIWPWYAEDSACNVSVNVNFHKVLDVDMSKGMLNLLIWFRLKWVDPRLKWDPLEWNNISSIWFEDSEYHSGEFWNPKIELWNSEEPIGFHLYPQQGIVSPEGEVFWSRNGQFYVACDMQGLNNFPYDNAQCTFEFGSWVYDESRVNMQIYDNGFSVGGSVTSGMESGFVQYSLRQVQAARYTYPPFDAGTQQEGWPVILYKVTLDRKHIHYTFKIVLPQAILTFVGFGAFWMSPACGERIGLTITIPLANAVYDLLVYEQLPESSKMVFASSFGVVCFLFSMFVVVESVLASFLWQKEDPYFAAPWRSIKKLYLDFQDQRDWVTVIKAMDEELAKLGAVRKPGFSRSERVSQHHRKSMHISKLQKGQRGISSGSISEIGMVNSTKLPENRGINSQPSANGLISSDSNGVVKSKSVGFEMNNIVEMRNSEKSVDVERQNTISDFDDISWLDEMSLANLTSENQVRELLGKVIHLHSNIKERKWVGAAFNRLTQRHGLTAVENRILSLVGVNSIEQQQQSSMSLKNYRSEAALEYNEKWKMLSKIVDRISQFLVLPAYISYCIITFVLVWTAEKGNINDEYFQE